MLAAYSVNLLNPPPDPGPPEFDLTSLNPNLFVDFTSQDYFTSDVAEDNLDILVKQLTTRDSNAYTSAPLSSGSLRFVPRFAMNCAYFSEERGFLLGDTNAFKWLHDGTTTYDLYIVWKQFATVASNTPKKVFCTVNNLASNATVGFQANMLNSATNPYTVKVAIYNAGGGTPGIAQVQGANNCVAVDGWNILRIRLDSSADTMNVSILNSLNVGWVSLGTDSTISGYSSASSVTALQIGGAVGNTMQIAYAFSTPYALDTEQQTNAETFFINFTENDIVEEEVNVYRKRGQSNTWGEALNSQIAPELAGKLGSYIYYCDNNNPASKVGFFTEAETGLTTQPSDVTKHGSVNRLAYEMSQNGTPSWHIVLGEGGTFLINNQFGAPPLPSWDARFQINANDNWSVYTLRLLTYAYEELTRVMRKRLILRGQNVVGHESDAGNARGTTTTTEYRDAMEAGIMADIDLFIALGVPRSDIRDRIFLTTPYQILGYPKGQEVYDATIDVVNNFLTRHPSYSDVVLGLTYQNTDTFPALTNHYTAVGQDMYGTAEANYFIPYVNE